MFNVNPFRAVAFQKSAIEKALESSGSLLAEVKYDGVRGNIVVKSLPYESQAMSSAIVLSRSNKIIPSLSKFDQMTRYRWAEFQRDFMMPDGMIIDCELMVKGETFQKSSGILRRKAQIENDRLHVIVYDILPIEAGDHGDEISTPLCVRRMWVEQTVAQLQQHFPEISWVASEQFEVYDMVSLGELYTKKHAEGHEGLIVKDPLGGYKRGKKTGWWKMKPEEAADGHVVVPNWGTVGLSNEGKIIGFEVFSEDGHVVNANGLTQAQMGEFTERYNNGETFSDYAVQFKFMERTDGGGFRHPSFDEWRGTADDPKVKI